LHIEQGGVLEANKQPIGVVNAIVGQRRYTITLEGESNHAGTTPMSYRRDTVHAFSRICCESIAKANAHGDPLVLTFGKVEPQPNTVNVVPGKTVFTIDCRHTDALTLRNFTEQLESDMRAICAEMASASTSICGWMKLRCRWTRRWSPPSRRSVRKRNQLPSDAQRSRSRCADFRATRPDLHDFHAQHQRH
jgi:hydantoinase/carbamoylase family amidase